MGFKKIFEDWEDFPIYKKDFCEVLVKLSGLLLTVWRVDLYEVNNCEDFGSIQL